MAREPVRGEWVWHRGKRVWREWAPEKCPACEHDQLLYGWGQRPCCQVMGRIWRCRACDRPMADPEHECRPATEAGR